MDWKALASLLPIPWLTVSLTIEPPVSSGGSWADAGFERPRNHSPFTGSALVLFGTDTLRVEVADTEREHERGLMERESVPEGTGMLFVFDEEASRSFWMENTPVSLDVAFLDAALRIVDIQTMEAMSTRSHTSARPAQYALEVRAGWFESKGIEVGTTAQFLPQSDAMR